MSPEQELQLRLDLLEEECLGLKDELQKQRLFGFQLQQRLDKIEKQLKNKDDEFENPWDNAGLL